MIDFIGKTFNRLEIIGVSETRKKFLICKCICGIEKEIDSFSVKSGATQSCGCLNRENIIKRATTHGESKSKMYKVYQSMLDRCRNPRASYYSHYGARGISVCAKWSLPNGIGYNNFKDDMLGGYKDGLTLERVDVNGNYCKENCCWITRADQTRNKRKLVSNSSGYTGVHISTDGVRGYYTLNSKRVSKFFSHRKYGEQALDLALQFRLEGIEFLKSKGVFYGEGHGK